MASLIFRICFIPSVAKSTPCPSSEEAAFLSMLQTAVAAGSKANVAVIVKYPLTVHLLKDRKTLVIENEQEFLAHYNELFDIRLVSAIADLQKNGLFCNYQGVAIGNGQLWFRRTMGHCLIIVINKP
jgi:hypothetical protein